MLKGLLNLYRLYLLPHQVCFVARRRIQRFSFCSVLKSAGEGGGGEIASVSLLGRLLFGHLIYQSEVL